MSVSSIPCRLTLSPPYQASKWQTCHILIDAEEMNALFRVLGDFWIVQISGLIAKGQEIIQTDAFLHAYQGYVTTLQRGEISVNPLLRSYFSSVFTLNLDDLYAVQANDTQGMVKICKPVIQLQPHRFDYSTADGKFRSMVLGSNSIHWGLQFSYPHLYQDDNLEVFTVREGAQFPNTALFKKLQAWVRQHTLATPFEIEGRRVNVPIRLGKQCFNWINDHPQLKARNLRVVHG